MENKRGKRLGGKSKCAGDSEAKTRKGSKKKYGQVLFCLSLRPYLQEEGFREYSLICPLKGRWR